MGEGKRQERNMKFIFIYIWYILYLTYISYIYDIYSIWLQLEISYVFKAKLQAAHKPQSEGFVTSAGSTAYVLKGYQWTNLVSSLFFFLHPNIISLSHFFFTIKMFLKLFFPSCFIHFCVKQIQKQKFLLPICTVKSGVLEEALWGL